jgi:hypothetical protein
VRASRNTKESGEPGGPNFIFDYIRHLKKEEICYSEKTRIAAGAIWGLTVLEISGVAKLTESEIEEGFDGFEQQCCKCGQRG